MPNLIQEARDQIEDLISSAAAKAAEAGTLPSAGEDIKGSVDVPRDTRHGDFASAWALAAAKGFKMSPRVIAESVVKELEMDGSFFSAAEIAGAGFINFRFSDKWYREVLNAVETEGVNYGRSNYGGGERVMVEFVSANPTGLMTIGNARGGVLGDTLASVLDRAGYNVWREFYVNDAGNQVQLFAESLETRYIQLIKGEDAVVFPENGYHGDDIWTLARAFREEQGDSWLDRDPVERKKALTDFGLERNIAKMHIDLERYGIKFDCWYRESALHASGCVEETVEMLQSSGHTYEKDGALWLNLTDLGAEKDEVLRKSNGFYTYFAVDMAYHRDKFVKRNFCKVIDVLGADHHGHAIRFKQALPAMGIDPDRLHFLIMQLVRLTKDGDTVRVSKRTGKAITLSDLLDEITCDAVRFFFNSNPDTHLEFDMDLAIRQDSENPVYYVQYAHARICSLIENLHEEGVGVQKSADIDMSKLDGEHERKLIKSVARLPEEIQNAAKNYDPSRINKYVQELAASFHSFYNNCRIKGEEPSLQAARLKLASATGRVIACSLDILGVSAPEKM